MEDAERFRADVLLKIAAPRQRPQEQGVTGFASALGPQSDSEERPDHELGHKALGELKPSGTTNEIATFLAIERETLLDAFPAAGAAQQKSARRTRHQKNSGRPVSQAARQSICTLSRKFISTTP
ncbi:hypothetical protein PQR62_11060 [Herbaspirillum lusitanum]|uniref:Uncharacterized protein n=1 Tax=Herbaspirillum lusitanum TaxID=213312 RepID=A0ABW9A7D9_9BURK